MLTTDYTWDCPAALVGTSLDPLTIDQPVRKSAIEEAMAERKALGLDRKSMPIRFASFEC